MERLLASLNEGGLVEYESAAMAEVQRSRDPECRKELGRQSEQLVPLLKQLGESSSGVMMPKTPIRRLGGVSNAPCVALFLQATTARRGTKPSPRHAGWFETPVPASQTHRTPSCRRGCLISSQLSWNPSLSVPRPNSETRMLRCLY